MDAQIFFIARLPRTLAGALVGAMLASAGVVFQGLLRNPLATPFTLGVSAGAALGAMLAITFGWSLSWLGIPAAPIASFAGSLMAVAIVYLLATARHRGMSTNVLLLAGVGILLGYAGVVVLRRVRLGTVGLYPALTLALAFVAVCIAILGAYALGEGETFIGISTLVVGGVLIGAVVTVIVSQLRAWLSGRK